MKPDWKDVPAQFNFLAMDSNGSWWAYTNEPRLLGDLTTWYPNGGDMARITECDDAWTQTVEARP